MADILSIGSSGLSAYRKSLEVTGNNIVNANTDGYTRRSADLSGIGQGSSGPTTIKASSGSGVEVNVVNRATDTFLQSQMRLAASNSSEATALSDRLTRLENSLVSGSGDIGKLAQTFFARMQDFSTSPSSIPVRATVIQAADDLASGFRSQANTLSQESDSVITDANSQLTQLNGLTKQLADLNSKLDQIGVDTTGASNDLLDQRDKLINQIDTIANFTTSFRPSGAVNLYLGSSTGSPPIVDVTGAKTIAASRVDGRVQLTVDPYGASTPVPSATGGTLGGILAYDDQINSLKKQLDQLATGFAQAINTQHEKGVDLNGKPGGALYSPNTFTVSAAPTNKSTVSASLDITNVQQIGPGTYTAQFNSSTALWTVTDPQNGQQSTGKDSVTIDGMKVNFIGTPESGDSFTFSPLENAAAGMHLLISDPSQLAASLPQLAQALTKNIGTALMTLNGSGQAQTQLNIPSIKDIFNQALSPDSVVGVKQDGVVASIPPGANNVTLYSLGGLSSATFKVDLKPNVGSVDTSTINNLDLGPLAIQVNGAPLSTVTLFPNGFPNDAASQANPAQTIADEMNRVLADTPDPSDSSGQRMLGDAVFASVNNGAITINALGNNNINGAAFLLPNGRSGIIAQTTTKQPAGDIQVLTTEGIQIAGLSAAGSSLITPTNGFSGQAVQPPKSVTTYATVNYDNSTTPPSEQQSIDLNNVISGPQNISIDGLTIALDKDDITPDQIGEKIVSYFQSPPPGWSGRSVSYDPTAKKLLISISSSEGNVPPLELNIPSKNSSYRNLNIVTTTSPVSTLNTTSNDPANPRVSTVNFDVTPETDSPWTSNAPTLTPNPGAVYALKVAGLPRSVRLAGDAIVGKNSTDIAATMMLKLNALGPQRSITGSDIDLSNSPSQLQFKITLNGQDNNVTFNRAIDPNTNQFTGGGTFTVDGNSNIKLSLVADPNDPTGQNQRVIVSLPQQLTTQTPQLSISSNDPTVLTSLGLNGSVQESIVSSGTVAPDTTDTTSLSSDFNLPSSANVTIASDGHVHITNVINSLLNPVNLTPVSTTTQSARDDASKFGFAGSDLTASAQGSTLTLLSSVTDDTVQLADTSDSVSRIGEKLTISSTIAGQTVPENLIVAVKGQVNGLRQVTATFPPPVQSPPLGMPDAEVDVISANQINIYALQTDNTGQLIRDQSGNPIKGVLLASRSYVSGEPINYMGSTFTIDGSTSVGDAFQITTDDNRSGDNRNAVALAGIETSDLFGKGSGSLEDIYTSTAGQIGASTAAAQTAASSAKTVADNISASYDSATGVSLDTEAAELIKLQQAYQACAQIVNTAQTLFASILKAAGG